MNLIFFKIKNTFKKYLKTKTEGTQKTAFIQHELTDSSVYPLVIHCK
jgi:hypothetical protein